MNFSSFGLSGKARRQNAAPSFPADIIRDAPRILEEASQQIQRSTTEGQLLLTQAAMAQEAPDIAALGLEGYKHMLAVDIENPLHYMVMLEREPGQPCQPIVLLITSFPEMPIEATADIHLRTIVTPITGEEGWQEFQRVRSQNNLQD
jgi:hypothetical protein